MRIDLPTLAGGEIGDELLSRSDTAKFRTGLRRARNVLLSPAGGAFNRPGMLFAGKVYDVVKRHRAVPFQFSTNQGYMLEMGHHTLRVVSQGGYILRKHLEVLSITNGPNAGVVMNGPHGYEVGWDVVFQDIEGMTEINGLTARILFKDATSFTTDIDSTDFGVFTGSGGGVAGNDDGGSGGDPPPPDPLDPPPPTPPFVDTEPEPPVYGGNPYGQYTGGHTQEQ